MLGCGWSREGARAGGGTRVVEGGSWYARGRSGGWPGRAFLRIGTLVIRRTGSSLLVVVEGDGGGGLWEAPVAECADWRCFWRWRKGWSGGASDLVDSEWDGMRGFCGLIFD